MISNLKRHYTLFVNRGCPRLTRRFIGEHGSLGFNHGQLYEVIIYGSKGYVWVMDVKSGAKCPYFDFKTLFDNWEINKGDD